jgi:molybdate transport system substrate-binding protein
VFPARIVAAEVSVAVAANFAAPMKLIAQDFERETGHKATLAYGATGQFYAQIRNGAPFAVLLAGDTETPERLERDGLAVAASRFTYAIGTLVLWSSRPGFVDDRGEVLRGGQFNKIALANPKISPYGAAAEQTLRAAGLLERLSGKIVEASNIAQAFQITSSGNAQLGFVALSQVFVDGKIGRGSGWVIPSSMHAPIRQDAILLSVGKDNTAAAALLAYLKSDKARAVIRAYGYSL